MALPAGIQFDRVASLQLVPLKGPPVVINPQLPLVAGVRPPDLELVFNVAKQIGPSPQRAEVRVGNLSALSRNLLATMAESTAKLAATGPSLDSRVFAATQATLTAGYSYASPGVLASGALLRASSRHVGTEWVTTLVVGDSAAELDHAECDRSFEPGTPAIEVIRYCAATMGLLLAPTPVPAAVASYILTRGWVAQGRSRQTLDAILAGVAPDLSGLHALARAAAVVAGQSFFDAFAGVQPVTRPVVWWVEDRQLWLLERGASLPAPPVVVSWQGAPGAAALLERPERADDRRVRVRMLLHPGVRLARRVQVIDPELGGIYRVDSLVHQGALRGGDFSTEATLLPVGL